MPQGCHPVQSYALDANWGGKDRRGGTRSPDTGIGGGAMPRYVYSIRVEPVAARLWFMSLPVSLPA